MVVVYFFQPLQGLYINYNVRKGLPVAIRITPFQDCLDALILFYV